MKTILFITTLFTSLLTTSAQSSFIKTYGGEGTQRGYCVRQTPDGGFIIAGYSSNDYDSDAYLIKTDAGGDTIWSRKYGGENDQQALSLQLLDDGYIFSGLDWVSDEFQTYLVRTDANGIPTWEKTQSLLMANSGVDLELTRDGGYASIGSWSFYPELQSMIFLKFNDQGDTVLAKSLNFTFGSEIGNSLLAMDEDQDYGYAVLATVTFDESSTTGDDLYLLRLNEKGDTLWTRKYGSDEDERGACIQQTPDKGFILAGSRNSSGDEDSGALLVKTDAEGNEEWMQFYGGDEISAHHVENTADGGFILAGYIYNLSRGNYDIYLAKTDSNGDTTWTRSINIGKNESAYWVEQTSDGGYIVTGTAEMNTGEEYEVCLVKLDANGGLLNDFEQEGLSPGIKVYQNHSDQTITLDYWLNESSRVSISLYNLKGQQVASILHEKQDSGLQNISWSTQGLPPGLYIGRLSANESTNSFKVILK